MRKKSLPLLRTAWAIAWCGFAALVTPTASWAEPYLAIATGLKCNTCHLNPTGGGKRTAFGAIYARTQLAAQRVLADESAPGWNGQVTDWLGVGGDLRGGYTETDPPGRPGTSDFGTSRGTVYAAFRAVPNLLTVYIDEQLEPGEVQNREAYALLTPRSGKYTVKAGQFFLPYGLRLQDDSAFVRQWSGINFHTPDDGLELGLELPKWSAQLAATNGTAGEGSAPGKHQYSLSASYVRARWRLGASANLNNDPLGDRRMLAAFAGFRTGRIAWLTELDLIRDELPTGGRNEIYATILEGDWRFRRGHNLKLSYEFVDPSDRAVEDQRERYSIVWEHSPIQLLQSRVGFRAYNGLPQLPFTNRHELFAELHVYF